MFNRVRTEGNEPHQILRALAAPEDLFYIDELLLCFDGIFPKQYQHCFELYAESNEGDTERLNTLGPIIWDAVGTTSLASKKKACETVVSKTLNDAVRIIEGPTGLFSKRQFSMFRATCYSTVLLARGSNPLPMIQHVTGFGLLLTFRFREWERCMSETEWFLEH